MHQEYYLRKLYAPCARQSAFSPRFHEWSRRTFIRSIAFTVSCHLVVLQNAPVQVGISELPLSLVARVAAYQGGPIHEQEIPHDVFSLPKLEKVRFTEYATVDRTLTPTSVVVEMDA